MSSLYSKLAVLKNDEEFFKNSKKNSTIKQLQKELKLSHEEAAIFSIIMSYQLNSRYAEEFSKIKEDFKLEDEDYLKYLNIAYKLEKKGLLSLAEKRRERLEGKVNELNSLTEDKEALLSQYANIIDSFTSSSVNSKVLS